MTSQSSPNFSTFGFLPSSADLAEIRKYFQEIAQLPGATQAVDRFFKFWFSPFPIPDNAAASVVKELIKHQCERYFLESFQESIYLLFVSWAQSRNLEACCEFLERLERSFAPQQFTPLLLPYRVRAWFESFYSSPDYDDLRRTIALYLQSESHQLDSTRWSDRYFDFCLKSISLDRNRPLFQRQFARRLAIYLQKRFQLKLALYVARSQSQFETPEHNPTIFGDDFVQILKTILASSFSSQQYKKAQLFTRKTQRENYQKFKKMLLFYLTSCTDRNEIKNYISIEIGRKLNCLFARQNLNPTTDGLRLTTCNEIANLLMTEDYQTPSFLFLRLVDRGKFLTLTSTLMKLLLVSPESRDRLEQCAAALLRYYERQPHDTAKRVIPLFEILKIALAIASKDIEYSLVAVKECSDRPGEKHLDNYRVFTQLKYDETLGF
ncbi:hypothetical protein CKA32_003907 [Geitlerinema sp. FC II]|nr:hypothetical protein CKA32_003907 [Geitlerinema sp. FC II]